MLLMLFFKKTNLQGAVQSSTLFILFLSLSLNALAEEIIIPEAQGIIVKASRYNAPLENVIGSTSIITSKDIEKSTATSLPELLMQVTGLNIIQAGSAGGQTSLFVRGTESNHTAILINGQQQKVSLGSVSLQYIDLAQIERIEIIRGPQSSLHGSDTIGGVINIITKTGGLGSSIRIEVGSHLSQLISLATSSENFHLGLSTRRSEGFDSLKPDTQNDKDGFELNSALLNYEHQWNTAFKSNFQANIQEGITEYDNLLFMADSTLPENHFKTHNLSVDNIFKINNNNKLAIKLGQARYENREYDNPYAVAGNFSIFTHNTLSIKSSSQVLPDVLLVLGGDLSDDTWKQQNDFNESLDNHALFSIMEFEKNRQLINLSARLDDNEQFGKHQTYRAAYEFRWHKLFTPFVSVGTGFKAPDFDELYSPWYSPNPDLQPETSFNQEIGFRNHSEQGQVRVNIFKQKIDDFITAELIDPINFIYQLQNLEQVEIKGLEFLYSHNINRLTINTNTSYIETLNTSDNSELIRRPRRIANIQLDYDLGQQGSGLLKTGLTLHGESKRKDIDYETGADVELPGFVLLDLMLNYQLKTDSKIQLKARNVLDKEYQVTDSYNAEGAAYSLGFTSYF